MMKVISWNVIGLNGKSKHPILKNNLSKEELDIMLIEETKCTHDSQRQIVNIFWIHFDLLIQCSIGELRGLTIIWNPSTIILKDSFSLPRILLSRFQPIGASQCGFISNVYGPNSPLDKQYFISNISSIACLVGPSHLILGRDFNMIHSL